MGEAVCVCICVATDGDEHGKHSTAKVEQSGQMESMEASVINTDYLEKQTTNANKCGAKCSPA